MACRPWYQPQLLQTMWGTFTEPHLGQVLRGGSPSVQADARRMRVLDFDVFFLGTAMASYL